MQLKCKHSEAKQIKRCQNIVVVRRDANRLKSRQYKNIERNILAATAFGTLESIYSTLDSTIRTRTQKILYEVIKIK